MNPLSSGRFDAVLFDLDGVLTATAKMHATCWKRLFDEFLAERAAATGEPTTPFDIVEDYKRYVDGKLRYEGVRSFLGSRGIELPEGTPDEPPGSGTICGLGNRKEAMVQDMLEADGVDVYEGSVKLVELVRSRGLRTAVVSASKNCKAVLEAARMSDLFDQVVDGEVAERLRLPGKPEPATFLAAAERLGVAPERAVVVEDAISGVQAGRAGGFGLVVGVDRTGDPDSLRQSGADIVVKDLGELL
ncbi:MAG: beta-phosphoglucomutase family hydrolase [Candidatus Deferrimicrobiaceae bacterium]